MTSKTGRCLCGSVQYSVDAEPLMTSVCHCDDCQRHSGTAFAVLAIFPGGSIVFDKKETLAEFVAQGESGANARRFFCRNCGSSIMSLADSAPDMEIIKAGTLDDKSWLKPASHHWCEHAQPWVPIDAALPSFQRNT